MRETPSFYNKSFLTRMYHSSPTGKPVLGLTATPAAGNLIFKSKFLQWFVGFTDGDGSFSIVKSGGTYRLHFGLGQSYYNIRILYYIKSMLGYGSITKYNAKKMAQLRITDRSVLKEIIFPIFEAIPLLTVKHFNYTQFKKAAYILEASSLTTEEKTNLIDNLRLEPLPLNFISPALAKLSDNLKTTSHGVGIKLSTDWLAGFIEAEGCFGIYPEKSITILSLQ